MNVFFWCVWSCINDTYKAEEATQCGKLWPAPDFGRLFIHCYLNTTTANFSDLQITKSNAKQHFHKTGQLLMHKVFCLGLKQRRGRRQAWLCIFVCGETASTGPRYSDLHVTGNSEWWHCLFYQKMRRACPLWRGMSHGSVDVRVLRTGRHAGLDTFWHLAEINDLREQTIALAARLGDVTFQRRSWGLTSQWEDNFLISFLQLLNNKMQSG